MTAQERRTRIQLLNGETGEEIRSGHVRIRTKARVDQEREVFAGSPLDLLQGIALSSGEYVLDYDPLTPSQWPDFTERRLGGWNARGFIIGDGLTDLQFHVFTRRCDVSVSVPVNAAGSSARFAGWVKVEETFRHDEDLSQFADEITGSVWKFALDPPAGAALLLVGEVLTLEGSTAQFSIMEHLARAQRETPISMAAAPTLMSVEVPTSTEPLFVVVSSRPSTSARRWVCFFALCSLSLQGHWAAEVPVGSAALRIHGLPPGIYHVSFWSNVETPVSEQTIAATEIGDV